MVLAAEWPSIQNNGADAATKFVYHCDSLDSLRKECRARSLDERATAYALSRWTRWKRHDAWLARFLEEPNVKAYGNGMDKERDFEIEGVFFDLKVTRYPRSASRPLAGKQLARWLYEHQSKQGRFHLANRLFVVARNQTNLYRVEIADRVVRAFCRNPETYSMSLEFDSSRLVKTAVIEI